VTAALVPEVAEARDHMRGSRGPTLLIFGDYECPYTRIAYRSVQFLEADGVPFRFVFRHFPLVEIHPHPIIRSLEPGEDWCRCYEDEIVIRADLAEAAT
jgi:hypothetical protein